MKKSLFQLFTFAILLTTFVACDKEETTPPAQSENLTEEEAVAIVESSVASETYGMTAQAVEMAESATVTLEKTPPCGVVFDTTITRQSAGSTTHTYFYEVVQHYELECDGIIPISFSNDLSTYGEYNTPRFNSVDSSEFSAIITNLQPAAIQYSYNGTYEREGTESFTSTINGNQRVFNSSINLETNNLLIHKDNKTIDGGTVNFTLTGTRNNGDTYTFSGTITFNGNGSATVLLNGNTYDIQI